MAGFDYFVVLADRRTGSNFLEANLNALDGVTCHGEAFNPNFIGGPKAVEVLGMSLAARDADPQALIDRVKSAGGLNGFRYFNGHDPRVLEPMLSDPKCGKIVLSRNPLDSFISLEIARKTQQWKLEDEARRKFEPITFNPSRFDKYISDFEAFEKRVFEVVRQGGQPIFYLSYDDLYSVDVFNRLSAFLGSNSHLEALETSTKKQNPEALSEKVVNFDEMMEALALRDPEDLARPAKSEARRGPSIHTYLATPYSGLMYQILRSGPTSAVSDWMSGLDDVRYRDLLKDFTIESFLDWRRNNPVNRVFTVLRHPVARAHAAFCDKILSTGKGSYPDIRKALVQEYGLDLPDTMPSDDYDAAAHRKTFLQFLRFVKSNLAGQTAIRIDPHWASQANTVSGFSDFVPPDMVLREDRLSEGLAIIAAYVGKETMPQIAEVTDPHADRLASIYDHEVEAAVQDVYQRDYIAFGFGPYA